MPTGTRIRLRVSPGAATTELAGRHGEGWKVRVRSPAERGRASAELIELLARTLAVPRNRIAVAAGRGGREKVVEVGGVERADVERRLAASLAGAAR